MKKRLICRRCHRVRPVDETRCCVDCAGILRGLELPKKKHLPVEDCPTVVELKKDTEALGHLADLEELASVPPERGGYHFSEWERTFIKSTLEQHDRLLEFTTAQRLKIKEIWQAADLRGRASPDEKAQNLFSSLTPERQEEMRKRAARVKFPWED